MRLLRTSFLPLIGSFLVSPCWGQELISLEKEIRERIDKYGGLFTACLKLANDPRPCFTMTFTKIYPVETRVDSKRVVDAGIPTAIFFQQYRVKNCSKKPVPVEDRITTRYSERTEVSFEKQIQNQNNVTGGFEANFFDIVKVTASASSTYSVTETNKKTTSAEREISSEKNFKLTVDPTTELLYTYQIAESRDYYSFSVTFVVDADIQYARGHINGTEKLSNVLAGKDLRTFTINGTVRNVTGGRADIGQSEAPPADCKGEEVVIDKK